MSDSMAEFVNHLRGFRIDCGGPSLREISRAARQRKDVLPVSTLSDNLKSTARPRWPFVEAFLHACREAAGGQLTDAELRRWRREWHLAYGERIGPPDSSRAAITLTADSRTSVGPEPFLVMCRDYVSRLQFRLSSVDLEVLAPAAERGDHPRMRMESVFVSPSLCLTGPQLELPLALRRALVETGQMPPEDAPSFVDRHHLRAAQRSHHERRPRNGIELLAARRRVVILGSPGAGKSALARYILLAIASRFGNPPASAPDMAQGPETVVLPPPIAQYSVIPAADLPAASKGRSKTHQSSDGRPEAATATRRPALSGECELDRIVEAWPRIRSAVAIYAPGTHALMAAGQPDAVSGDVLELSHQRAALAMRLAQSSHTHALETVIERILGHRYAVRWLLPEDAVIDDLDVDDGEVEARARRWARPPATLGDLVGWLPIWIELRALASVISRYESVLDYLDCQYRSEGFGFVKADLEQYLLTDGRAVVVFDGLDEIFDTETRHWATRQIEGFAHRYPSTRIIVTSRILGYRQKHLADAGFDHFTVQDLTHDQIEKFARTWAASVFPQDIVAATAMAQRLLRAIDRSPTTAELAANPMLLTILASVSRHQELPHDRASVLQHAVTVLVDQWDTSKLLPDSDIEHSSGLTFNDKLQLLQLAARQMHRRGDRDSGNHCTAQTLVDAFCTYLRAALQLPADRAVLLARAMLTRFRVRSSLLAHLGGEIYGFIHRAFLDYLTAVDLHHRWIDNELTDQQVISLFHDTADDPAWSETLSLLATMVPTALAALLAADLINHGKEALTYQCSQSDNPDDYFWEEFIPTPHTLQALTILAHLPSQSHNSSLEPHRAALTDGVIRLLREADRAESWGMLDTPSFLDTLARNTTWMDRPRYHRWYEYWSPGAGPSRVSEEVFPDDRATSWQLAARLYLDQCHDHQVLNSLTDGGDPMVASLALQQLISEFDERPDTQEGLLRHATEHPVAEIRAMAVRALAGSHLHPPDMIELMHRYSLDSSAHVRFTAFDVLAENWQHDSATLPCLLASLANDSDDDLRDELARLVVERWPEDGSVWQALCERVLHDTSSTVRLTAIEALVNWMPENELPEPIVERAYGDEDEISAVAGPAYQVMTARRVLRDAGISINGTAATVAGVHAREAWALARESTPTETLEFAGDAGDLDGRFVAACARMVAEYFGDAMPTTAYLAIPEQRVWQCATFDGTPDYAQLLGPAHHRRGLTRPITKFAMISTDGAALICANVDDQRAYVVLAVRDESQAARAAVMTDDLRSASFDGS
ncbi:HEAT repeat domain-containing protein [Nocardia sp. NPDC052001]|uniref:HEAT repeat domain-containing protein n=1 Tax=Nocardia sp. NPDC052001 TaxID=3154853 RepID=UPI00343970FA